MAIDDTRLRELTNGSGELVEMARELLELRALKNKRLWLVYFEVEERKTTDFYVWLSNEEADDIQERTRALMGAGLTRCHSEKPLWDCGIVTIGYPDLCGVIRGCAAHGRNELKENLDRLMQDEVGGKGAANVR